MPFRNTVDRYEEVIYKLLRDRPKNNNEGLHQPRFKSIDHKSRMADFNRKPLTDPISKIVENVCGVDLACRKLDGLSKRVSHFKISPKKVTSESKNELKESPDGKKKSEEVSAPASEVKLVGKLSL